MPEENTPHNTEASFKNRDAAMVVLHFAQVLGAVMGRTPPMLVGSVAATGMITGLELARRHPKMAQRLYDAFADELTERAAADMTLCVLNDGHKGQINDASTPPSEPRPKEPDAGL